MAMGLYEKTMAWLADQADGHPFGSKNKLADHLGLKPSEKPGFYKNMSGAVPNAKSLLAWIEALGARIVFPDSQEPLTKTVQFVQPRVVNVPNGTPGPSDDRWLAVPFVGMAGAGRGRLDLKDLGEYLMVLRDHPAIMDREDLIGVEIGKREESMKGTIDPGDIVIVDRGDCKEKQPPGNIFLVADPDSEYGCMVKRVVLDKKKDRMNIVFYSDNAVEYPPMIFDFKEHFGNDIKRALIGRVVVCFSDMRKK